MNALANYLMMHASRTATDHEILKTLPVHAGLRLSNVTLSQPDIPVT